MKYAFIRDELARACTARMACPLLEVSPSGYYRFLKAPVAARKVRRLAVEDAVVRIHAELRRIYGAAKIAHEPPRLGVSAHRNTVSRIMQEHGIRAESARKLRPTTTHSGHGHGASPDLLGRDFAAVGPNRKWLCDIPTSRRTRANGTSLACWTPGAAASSAGARPTRCTQRGPWMRCAWRSHAGTRRPG